MCCTDTGHVSTLNRCFLPPVLVGGKKKKIFDRAGGRADFFYSILFFHGGYEKGRKEEE